MASSTILIRICCLCHIFVSVQGELSTITSAGTSRPAAFTSLSAGTSSSPLPPVPRPRPIHDNLSPVLNSTIFVVVSLVDIQPPLQLKSRQTGLHPKSALQERSQAGGTEDQNLSIREQDGKVLIDPEKPWESLLDPRESFLLPFSILKFSRGRPSSHVRRLCQKIR